MAQVKDIIMDSMLVFTGVASGIAGAVLQYLLSSYIWPNRHRVYTWWFALRNHSKFGEPCHCDIVLRRDGYRLGFNPETRSAAWVCYIVSKRSIGVNLERGERFYPDLDIPLPYRVKPEDFTNSGFDKGHLAPSAAIDFSRRSNDQTFAMSNIVLQHPKLNRQAWGRLEELIREWTTSKGALAVACGPLYGKRPKMVNDIPVPNSFYNIIYSLKHKKCIGFIFPNEPVSAADLWRYAMPASQLEKETGYKFLSRLGKKGAKIKNQLDVEWWQKK
jgi:endonuclease G